MHGKRAIIISAMVILLFSTSVLSAASSPIAQLQVTVDKIIEILRNHDLSEEAVLETVGTLVRQKFDFRAMSQRTLGVHWKNGTEKQQDRFVELFSQLLEDTYRGRIQAYTYNDEYVKYVDERILGTRAEVKTIVVLADREIPVNYRVRLKGSEWLIYDVVIEEVSLVSNYRNTYGQIIQKEGFDVLLSRMEERIQQLQANPQSGAEPAPKAKQSNGQR